MTLDQNNVIYHVVLVLSVDFNYSISACSLPRMLRKLMWPSRQPDLMLALEIILGIFFQNRSKILDRLYNEENTKFFKDLLGIAWIIQFPFQFILSNF